MSKATQRSVIKVKILIFFRAEDPSARRQSRYQGVRVKNTVKELIMQKRHHEIQVQVYVVISDFMLSCIHSASSHIVL